SMRSPTNPAPISPDRPIPKMVSARPAATWLTASPSVSAAKIAAMPAPASVPQIAPMKTEPVKKAAAKPHAAPMIIMPSMPRLSTPARSTTSSPAAASNSGVDAAITETMMASSNPIGNPGARRHQTNAVEDQGIAGEHVEQQDALEHLGKIERHLHRDL